MSLLSACRRRSRTPARHGDDMLAYNSSVLKVFDPGKLNQYYVSGHADDVDRGAGANLTFADLPAYSHLEVCDGNMPVNKMSGYLRKMSRPFSPVGISHGLPQVATVCSYLHKLACDLARPYSNAVVVCNTDHSISIHLQSQRTDHCYLHGTNIHSVPDILRNGLCKAIAFRRGSFKERLGSLLWIGNRLDICQSWAQWCELGGVVHSPGADADYGKLYTGWFVSAICRVPLRLDDKESDMFENRPTTLVLEQDEPLRVSCIDLFVRSPSELEFCNVWPILRKPFSLLPPSDDAA
jgi:hypothetical protein